MVVLVRIFVIVLAVTFAWAAAAKLINFRSWRSSLGAYGLGRALNATSIAVPLLELSAAALLVFADKRTGAALALALIAIFSLGLVRARALRGSRLPCGCFGRTKERDFKLLLVRNAALAIMTGYVLIARAPEWRTAVDAPSGGDIVPAMLVTIGLVLLTWIVLQARDAFGKGPQ